MFELKTLILDIVDWNLVMQLFDISRTSSNPLFKIYQNYKNLTEYIYFQKSNDFHLPIRKKKYFLL